jgi:pSer/pThr/pTyr-binding forkhead associated (FHA) protein
LINFTAMPQIRVYLSEDNQNTHELGEETLSIGRLADNAIQIEDASVSSHHGEIVFHGGEYVLRDLGSTNGTFVNGAQVTEVTLKGGEQLRFGSVEAAFVGEAHAGGSQPLPQSSSAVASLGEGGVRPANFANLSPFPKPKEKADALTYAAVVLGVLGAVGFLASVILSLTLQPPA